MHTHFGFAIIFVSVIKDAEVNDTDKLSSSPIILLEISALDMTAINTACPL